MCPSVTSSAFTSTSSNIASLRNGQFCSLGDKSANTRIKEQRLTSSGSRCNERATSKRERGDNFKSVFLQQSQFSLGRGVCKPTRCCWPCPLCISAGPAEFCSQLLMGYPSLEAEKAEQYVTEIRMRKS